MIFKKLYYKLFKSKKKNEFKDQLKVNLFKEKYEGIINQINKSVLEKKELNFLHSGTSGDLIYSFSLIKKLSQTHKCNFYIGVNKKFTYEYYKHTGDGFLISERMYNLIIPLLRRQKFFNQVKKHENETIDINLDLFRELPWNSTFNSPRWYFHIAGEHADLNDSYLDVDEHASIKKKIVIQRTFRHRNIYINYNFLKNYDDPLFVGIKEEYEDLKKQVPNLEFYDPKDFLEIAQIIKSSRFFIGNQSVCFPIAEALKVPRLLEASPDTPLVQPVGKNGFDFYFQPHFEKWFKYLYENTK